MGLQRVRHDWACTQSGLHLHRFPPQITITLYCWSESPRKIFLSPCLGLSLKKGDANNFSKWAWVVHPALGENWLHYGDSTQLVLAQVSAHRNYKMMNLSCFKAMKCVVICSTAMENQYVLQCFIIVCKRNHRTDSLVKALNGRTHWKDWCWNWSTNTLAIWCEELTHWKRPRCRERLKAGGEGDDRERDGWMTSLTQWTWVWASSGSWWWTEKPGMLQSMGSQRVGHDWVTELRRNWTKQIKILLYVWISSSSLSFLQST